MMIKLITKSIISMVIVVFPVLLIVNIAVFHGFDRLLITAVQPIMSILDLPEEFSIVWLAAILTGVYGGVATFFTIASESYGYRLIDINVLSILILLAHALPVESRVSSLVGVGFVKATIFRIVNSIVCALLLMLFCNYFELLQSNVSFSSALITPKSFASYFDVIWQSIAITVKMCVIIVLLFLLIELLKKLSLINLIEKLLLPLVSLLRLDIKLSHPLLIGILLGISYGGVLLKESLGELSVIYSESIKKAIYFMNLSHSLIEDTLLVLMINANIVIVVIYRLAYSIIVIRLMALFLYVKSQLINRTGVTKES
ncbi:hypothetical protein H0A36_03615 [Endozoicomonas sp. SM1973]|uniref:Nucleoside recognition protein n=1 Tax=Spartinivicinus marinus TaxID=2994442 RepID=A0A853HV05_9GAMM|nr:hypothetical protein [Spartinivicinus marinus]MCX4029509.1 hypothetical protein [Spartinivicinus marinus]NYZ65083.1 hypothetical protein [Spartinivicinus marinus]